jgi:hypothetical protein
MNPAMDLAVQPSPRDDIADFPGWLQRLFFERHAELLASVQLSSVAVEPRHPACKSVRPAYC